MKINKNGISFNVVDGQWTDFWKNDDWEIQTWNIFSKYITKNQNYLDIGAWIGPTVLYGSQLCKTCYAIEPDPIAIKDLNENVCLNKFENVFVYNCAISNFTGKTKMGSHQLGDSMTRFVSDENVFEVDCYTLSNFVDKYNISDLSFVKMDIEGSEEQALMDLDFFEKRIPLHLSLHHIFYQNSDKAIDIIFKVCKMYKNMYDENFNRVDLSYISNKEYNGFLNVVLE